MRAIAISSVLLLFLIFNYNLFGNYEDPVWNCIYYMGFSSYIFVILISILPYAIIKIRKQIFIITSVYFVFYFATEGICFFEFMGKPLHIGVFEFTYYTLVTHANLYLSGGFLIMILFLILTYKAIIQ